MLSHTSGVNGISFRNFPDANQNAHSSHSAHQGRPSSGRDIAPIYKNSTWQKVDDFNFSGFFVADYNLFSHENMLACCVQQFRGKKFCKFLIKLDKKEYQLLLEENQVIKNTNKLKISYKMIFVISALTLFFLKKMMFSLLTDSECKGCGSVLYNKESKERSQQASLIFGVFYGLVILFAACGGKYYYENHPESTKPRLDPVIRKINANRLSRMDAKIRQINDRIEKENISPKERNQLLDVNAFFKIVRSKGY